jgi:uncharacterized protein YcfJ
MNRSVMLGIGAGVVLAGTAGAIAGLSAVNATPRYAEVITTRPAFATRRVAEEVCRDETVTRRREPKDEHRVAGTALGAVVGGVLGNQVGDGRGRTLATVAGATAGGYAGNRVQKRMQDGNTYQATERRCETVQRDRREQVGFDVRYRFGDRIATVRLEHDPGVGARFPVRDGRIVFTARTAAQGPERT